MPLNTRFQGKEAAFILEKSRARILCVVDAFLGRDYPASLEEAVGGPGEGRPYASLPLLEKVVVLGDGPAGRHVSWADFLASGRSVPEDRVRARAAEIDPDDLSDMLFTSGTTGNPKGAMCTHAQTLRAYAVWAAVVGLREGDRYLVVNPFFHGFGHKAGWPASFIVGATVLKEELGFAHIVTGYGLTESCAIVSMCRYDDPPEVIVSTAGRPLPGLEVVTVDRDGKPTPTGVEGEILVRGYTVMKGYFGEDEETAATVDADGWLHTGDVGVPDERLGEVGAAFVVPRRGAGLDPDALIAWARRNMANYKVPRQVHVVDALPVNAAGKVLKTELRARLGGRLTRGERRRRRSPARPGRRGRGRRR